MLIVFFLLNLIKYNGVELQDVLSQGSRNYTAETMQLRNSIFRDYFVSDAGRVTGKINY